MKIKNHVGTDIESVKRFKKNSYINKEFYSRVFTPKEIAYCNSKACPEQHFAARFAAKEAVIKAVNKLEKVFYSDVEIINDKVGRPLINLSNKIKKLKKDNFSISLAHTESLAIAFVVYMEELNGRRNNKRSV